MADEGKGESVSVSESESESESESLQESLYCLNSLTP